MYLWSGTLSPFSAKVRLAMAEKGIEADVREIPWSRQSLWGPKPQAFLDVSPRAEVPALVDGELGLFDSTVINEYLEERFPEPPLMPREREARATCRLLEDQADHHLAKHVTILIREVFMKPGGQDRDEHAVAEAFEAFAAFHAMLDARLGSSASQFLCGTFTFADIATYLCVTFGQTLGAPISEDHAHLRAWHDRVSARPTVAREMTLIVAAAAAA